MLKKSKISLTLYIRDNFELILFALAYFLLSISVLYERVIFIQDYLSIIKAISLSLFVLQILLNLSKKRYAKKELAIYSVFFAICALIFLQTGFFTPMRLLIVIVSCKTISFRKIITIDLILKIFNLITLILLFTLHATTDFSFSRDNISRYALGFSNPNMLAMHVSLAIIDFLYLKEMKIKSSYKVLMLLILAVVFILTNSRSILLIATLLFSYLFLQKKIDTILTSKKIILIIMLLPFIIGITSIVFSINQYSTGSLAYNIDKSLSGRIWLQSQYMKNYNITLLGNHIVFDKPLDSFYIRSILSYGIVGLLFYTAIIERSIFLGKTRNNKIIIFIYLIFVLYGIIENLQFDVAYNAFLAFCIANDKTDSKNNNTKRMAKQPKISIIIPCHNSQKYIKDCIDSLLCQKYSNVELLFIDDGSTDKTRQIIESYLPNSAIKYIYQNNSGVSHARNLGIKVATGDYICFVDSDDVVTEDYLLDFVSLLQDNFDYICCDIKEFKASKSGHILNDAINIKKYNNKDIYNLALEDCKTYIGNKIFLKSIITKNKIAFNNKILMCEDMSFCLAYISHCKSAAYIQKANYLYRIHSHSASRLLKNHGWFTIFTPLNELMSIYQYLSKESREKLAYHIKVVLLEAKYRRNFTKMPISRDEKTIFAQSQKMHINLVHKFKYIIYKTFPNIAFTIKIGGKL